MHEHLLLPSLVGSREMYSGMVAEFGSLVPRHLGESAHTVLIRPVMHNETNETMRDHAWMRITPEQREWLRVGTTVIFEATVFPYTTEREKRRARWKGNGRWKPSTTTASSFRSAAPPERGHGFFNPRFVRVQA